MKRLFVLVLLLTSGVAQGKLSDQQSMKCIDADRLTKSTFQDLQAAYEMRLVTAKDFLLVMDKPSSCPQLRKDLKKLHASAVSAFPQTKPAVRTPHEVTSDNGFGGSPDAEFGAPPPPPPPPMPESDFADEFSDFR